MGCLYEGIIQFYLPHTHEPYLPLHPSRKASPPSGWYSLRLLTKGWPGWVRVAQYLNRPTGRVGSGQDGLGTQVWRHEIKLVIKCCLVCILCHIWLLYIILSFSMYMYAGDMTVDEMLSASASAWNCRHNGTIVLIPRCAVLQQVSATGGGGTSLKHSSKTSLAASLIIVRMR